MGKALDTAFAGAFTFLTVMLILSLTGRDSRLCAAIALLAAYCACVIVGKIFKKQPRLSFNRRRILADRRVKALIYQDAAKAHEYVFSLLKRKYPISEPSFENGHMRFTHMGAERSVLCVIQKLRVTPDDILNTWRNHGRDADRAMVIAAVGRSEQDIRIAALRLNNPTVTVFDKKQLRALARKYGAYDSGTTRRGTAHPLKALSGFITRRRAWRYLLYACLLNAYYLVTGGKMYLLASLALAAATMLSVRRRAEPEQLI